MNTLYLAKGPDAPARRPEAGSSTLFLCYSWDALQSAAALGLAARPWEDDFSASAAPEVAAEAERLAESWYKDGALDVTLSDGVSLGRAHRWIVWVLTIQPALKFLAALSTSLDREGAVKLRCETSLPALHRAAAEALAAHRGIPLEWVEHPGAGGDIYAWTAPSLRRSLKQRLAAGLVDLLARLRGAADARPFALVSHYPSLDGLLDRPNSPLRWVLADFPPKRRLGAAWRGAWRLLTGPSAPPRWDEEGLRRIERLRADWARLREDPAYARVMSFRGASLLGALRPALDEVFRDLEQLAWSARELTALWKAGPPAVVVLPYDTPPYQCLLADVARLHGTPTALILHGIPFGGNYPFAETNCTDLFVWGPEQKRHYEGREGRTVRAVGNPGFDRYTAAPAPLPGKIRRVLVFPRSKWGDVLLGASDFEPERYLLGVIEALRAAGDFEIVFRPHPAESPEYYENLLRPLGGRVTLEPRRPLAELMAEADLVIGAYSTTLLETMLLGKPLLCLNFTPGLEYAAPFDGKWGVEVVRTPAELRRRLERLVAQPEAESRSLLAPYARVLAAFAGPADGESSSRLLTELAEVAA